MMVPPTTRHSFFPSLNTLPHPSSPPPPPPPTPLFQAKELVESAPCVVMAKVKKEDAAKIAEKLKTETGAEVELA
jgi:hypothetical protein